MITKRGVLLELPVHTTRIESTDMSENPISEIKWLIFVPNICHIFSFLFSWKFLPASRD